MDLSKIKSITQINAVNIELSNIEKQKEEDINISFSQNTPYEELTKQYGLSTEDLSAILSKYPNFAELDAEKQQEIASEYAKIDVEQEVTTDEISEQNDIKETKVFDNLEYSKKSYREKFETYTEELAKNKFIYSDKSKSLEQWNNLTDEQRNLLIKKEADSLKANKDLFDNDDMISMYLDGEMDKLQAANYKEISINEYNKLEKTQRFQYLHEYISQLDNRSKSQEAYIKQNVELSKAVVDYCKSRGEEFGDKTRLSYEEIDELCKKYDTDIVKVQIEYFKNLKLNGLSLNDQDEKNYKKLTEIENLKNKKVENYDRLNEFLDSDYGKLFEETYNRDNKIQIVIQYENTKFKGLNEDERRKAISDLHSQLLASSEEELVIEVHQEYVKSSSPETQKAIATEDTGLTQELNAININSFDKESSVLVAEKQKSIAKTDSKRGEELALITLDNADEEHLGSTSQTYAGFGLKTVEDKHADISYDKDKVTAETQAQMHNNIALYSNIETKKYAAAKVHEAYKENQVTSAKVFMKDKDVAVYMNKSGTLAKCDKSNQIEIFESFKNRFEQNDFTKDEAINQLNTLSDQIKYCDKDNQLVMHKSIMSSQYSEVQEHAASNIKNYDPSVQNEAMDTVYNSGNQKAVEIAVNSIIYSKSIDVARIEVIRLIGEEALNDKNADIEEKFLAGNLTYKDLQKLPANERRQYIKRYFKQLPTEQKIKLLSSLSTSMKKSVYTMIARTDNYLFTEICKDKDRASILLEMGLPEDVCAKVKSVVRFLAVSNIGFQKVAIDNDIAFDNQKSYPPSGTFQHSSLPFNEQSFLKFKKNSGFEMKI